MESESASGSVRITADQVIDGDPFELIGETLDKTEVEPTYRVRVCFSRVGEGAVSEDVFKRVAAPLCLGFEPSPGDGLLQGSNPIIGSLGMAHFELASSATAGLLRAGTGSKHVDQEHAEPLVWTSGSPSSIGGRVDPVEESGSSWRVGCGGHLGDEPCFDQLGEVLADGIVVEFEVQGELGDVYGTVGVGDVSKHSVSGGVAQGSCLWLEGLVTSHGGSLLGRLRGS